jgi:hypothetical protein
LNDAQVTTEHTVRINNTLVCLLISGLTTVALGCGGGSRQASVAAWQKNVEQYVRVQGKGDPAVLRDLTLSDSRRGFAMVGSDVPSESTDANGLLIGFREIDGRGYFIYLVGVVERQRVKEIHLAALTTDGGKMEWKTGPNSSAALDAYCAYNDKLWRGRFPDRKSAPPQYTGFPTPDDHFNMVINGNHVTATHPPSGATWELTLPAAPRRA